MSSVWICSRSDADGNIAGMAVAHDVFGRGSAWPGLLMAAMAGLALTGGIHIIRQSRGELANEIRARTVAA